MSLNSGLPLHCVGCLQVQVRFMRQCRCLYCEMCRKQATERCACGQGGGFLDLFGPNQEEGLMLTLDSTSFLKKLIVQFQEHVFAGVQKTFGVLKEVQTVKEGNMLKYIQALERQLATVNAEKEALKTQLMTLQSGRAVQSNWRGNTPCRDQYEPFDARQIRTPAPPMRQIVPRTSEEYREKTLKRPFSHEAFGAFFRK